MRGQMDVRSKKVFTVISIVDENQARMPSLQSILASLLNTLLRIYIYPPLFSYSIHPKHFFFNIPHLILLW